AGVDIPYRPHLAIRDGDSSRMDGHRDGSRQRRYPRVDLRHRLVSVVRDPDGSVGVDHVAGGVSNADRGRGVEIRADPPDLVRRVVRGPDVATTESDAAQGV